MPFKKQFLIIAILSLLLPIISACGSQKDIQTDIELAVAIALTQTAIVLEAQPPTAQPSPTVEPTPEEALRPISDEACNALTAAVGQNLGVTGEISQVAFEDEIVSHLSGTGCGIEFSVSGVNFEDPSKTLPIVGEALKAQGWQEDPLYMAIGLMGEIRGYRSGNGLCRLWINGHATDSDLCADHATINTCWPTLAPEQRIISVALICAQGDLPEFIPQVLQPPDPVLKTVEFAAGTTAAQLVGKLLPGGVDHYVLRANVGQSIVLSVYPPGVVAIAVVGTNGEVLKSDLDNSTEWSGTIPISQEYFINVTSVVNIESEYTLDVSIPPLEPIATTGEVAGAIGYPDASIPPLHIVAYNQDSGFWYYLAMGENNFYYFLPGLPPGQYHIAAYAKDGLNGFYIAGGAPVVVTVTADETTEGIDLTQWFAAGSGPYPNDPVGW